MSQKTLEDTYIKNIENAMRAIRLGTKKPKDTNIAFNLNKLKLVNPGMFDDLILQYKKVLEDYKTKLLASGSADQPE